MSSLVSNLFTEVLRPQCLEQALLVDRIRVQLLHELQSQNGIISNLLFYGQVPGCGKTTMSRIMAKGHDTKIINCSGVGVDSVREDIQLFAAQMSIESENPIKVVLLEECDGFTEQAWNAMRATVERFSNNVRFIANCNYIEKVPKPIRSRFTCIQFEPINDEERKQLYGLYAERTAALLTKLQIAFTPEQLEALIMESFPDYRSVLTKIQQLHTSGVKDLGQSAMAAAMDYTPLFNLILSAADPLTTYKTVRDAYGENVEAAVAQIGQKFPEYMSAQRPDLAQRLPLIVITVAEHQDQLVRAINKNIVLQSLVFKCQTILFS